MGKKENPVKGKVQPKIKKITNIIPEVTRIKTFELKCQIALNGTDQTILR